MVAPVSAPGPVAGLPALHPAPLPPAGGAERPGPSGPGPTLAHSTAAQRAPPQDDPVVASRRRDADSSGQAPHRPSTTFLAQAISQEIDAESGSPSGGDRDPRSVAGLYERTSQAVDRSLVRSLTPPPEVAAPAR